MTIQELERRKMSIDLQIDGANKELDALDGELEKEGISAETDVEAFLADLAQQKTTAESEHAELLTKAGRELDKAQEIIDGEG